MHNNDSALNKLNTIYQFQDGLESRIIATIGFGAYTFGISEGDVIYFDIVTNQYRKSQANNPVTSEVYGIVESINADKSLNVILNGSVKLQDSNLINIQYSDNIGGNDVYFLSESVPGKLQNYGPTFAQTIIKPLYIAAPHGKFTGLFRNYLGYLNPYGRDVIFIFNTFRLANFSQDGSKSVWFNEFTESVSVRNNLHSTDSFTFTTVYEFKINEIKKSLPININFAISENYDMKVSNDGIHILLFDKLQNKIFHIVNGIDLVATIDVELTGSPTSKIWEVDDELTCLIIGSTSLQRAPLTHDNAVVACDISSRINYWRRTPNNISNPYKWKQTFQQNAFGSTVSISPATAMSSGFYDELYLHVGVNRLACLSVKNKNFAISCKTLIEDQIDYKSKVTALFANRYTSEMLTNGGLAQLIGVNKVTALNPSVPDGLVLTAPVTASAGVTDQNIFNNLNLTSDNPINKKYCCSFGLDQCHILQKNGSYYYENQSHKKKNFKYEAIIPPINSVYGPTIDLTYYNNQPGRTLSNSIKQLVQLTHPMDNQTDTPLWIISSSATSNDNFIYPVYERNALHSSCSSTETFNVYGLLYEYRSSTSTSRSKQLILLKYPTFSFDGFNTLMNYEPSSDFNRVLPNDGTEFGYVTSFRTTSIGNQRIGDYSRSGPIDHIPCVFSSENVISSIDINAINYFKIFTSNARCFICFANQVIVWTYATSSYQIISIDNLDTSKFYYTGTNEFFIRQSDVLRFNSATNTFILQTL